MNRFMNIYILFHFKWNQLTYKKGEQNVYQSVYGLAFTFLNELVCREVSSSCVQWLNVGQGTLHGGQTVAFLSY